MNQMKREGGRDGGKRRDEGRERSQGNVCVCTERSIFPQRELLEQLTGANPHFCSCCLRALGE